MTPFPKDDVGWVLDNVGLDMLLFSPTFPGRFEGTRRPDRPLRDHLDRFDAGTREKFDVDRMRELLGEALVSAA